MDAGARVRANARGWLRGLLGRLIFHVASGGPETPVDGREPSRGHALVADVVLALATLQGPPEGLIRRAVYWCVMWCAVKMGGLAPADPHARHKLQRDAEARLEAQGLGPLERDGLRRYVRDLVRRRRAELEGRA